MSSAAKKPNNIANNQKDGGAGDGDATGPGKKPEAGQAGTSERCPICLLPIAQPVVTDCGHMFCLDCLNYMVCTARVMPRCPLCRQRI